MPSSRVIREGRHGRKAPPGKAKAPNDPKLDIDREGLGGRIAGLPGFRGGAQRRRGREGYLVGGAVRDAFLGHERADLDVVVVGDHLALARALGEEIRTHDRFDTATVTLDQERGPPRPSPGPIPHPGALPEVRPAGIDEDLSRRDFSVNAMAVALSAPAS